MERKSIAIVSECKSPINIYFSKFIPMISPVYVYTCFVLIHQIAIQHRTLKTTTIIMTVKKREKNDYEGKKATEKK